MLILVADDDHMIVDNIRLALNICFDPADFVISYSSDNCLRMIKQVHPDLVIVKSDLSNFSGKNIIPQIRALSKSPLIALVSIENEAETLQAYEAGADICVDRNTGHLEIIARVRALLREHGLQHNKMVNRWNSL